MADFLHPDPYSLSQYGSAATQPMLFPNYGLGPLGEPLAALAANFMGGQPIGWNNTNNLYMSFAARQALNQHNARMSELGRADSQHVVGAVQAAARLGDIRLSPQVLDELRRNSSGITGFVASNFLGTDEGARIYDTLMGGRSSAALGKFVSDYGRYALDSGTGRVGLSDASFKRVTAALSAEYGGQNRFTRGGGLSLGEVGELTRELGSRGFLGAGKDEASQLAGIKRALDDKIKAVVALKEVFGAAGEPNAPLPKLLNALEAMTGGSQQFNGGRLESIVRNLKTASETSGVGLQQVSALLEMNSKMLSSAGINSAFAAPITERQMLTHLALAQTGALQTPAWGLLSQSQLAGLQAAQETRAVGSASANLLGAVARLRAQGQKMGQGGDADLLLAFASESQAGRLGPASARLAGMDTAQQTALLAGAFGMSAQSASAELRYRDANAEFVYNTNAQAHVAGMQALEFGRKTRGQTSARISGLLTERGMSSAAAGRLSGGLSERLYETLLGMDNVTRNDAAKREGILAKVAETHLRTTGGQEAAGVAGNSAVMTQLGSQFYNELNEVFRATNGVSLNNFLTINSPEVRAAREANAQRNKVLNTLQSSFAGANMSPGMRVADALLSYSSDASQSGLETVFKALNIRSTTADAADTKKVLGTLMENRRQLYDQYFDTGGSLRAGVTKDEAAAGLKKGMAAINQQLDSWVGDNKDRQALVAEILRRQQADGGAEKNTTLQLAVENMTIRTAGGREIELNKGESEPTEAKSRESVDGNEVKTP